MVLPTVVCLLPSHLNALSARASTFGGIVRPICLAAFRLITSSNFVGCSTGKFESYSIDHKTVTYVPGTLVTLVSGLHTPFSKGTSVAVTVEFLNDLRYRTLAFEKMLSMSFL